MSTRPATASRRENTRARRELARERILAAAEQLMNDRPFRELTVDHVMAEAGLSRTVFYRHFDGLPEVVLALLAKIEAELAGHLAPAGRRASSGCARSWPPASRCSRATASSCAR